MTLPTVLSGATYVSHVSSSATLNMAMSLTPANRAGLVAFSNSVSDPTSANYHRFLTPTQVGTKFGASTTTVNTAVAYLKSKGLTVGLIAKNHMAIVFSGKVSAIESAFSTKINNYSVSTRPTPGPLAFYSAATVPKLPSTFAGQVVTIDGLSNANPPIKRTTELRPIDARNVYDATPLYGSSNTGGHKGEGVNIGISNFDGYRLTNAAIYANTFNLPLPGGTGTNIHKVIVGGVDGETQNAGAEGDLDYQMVLGIAPKSDVYIYDGIGGGLIATLTEEADDNIVDIMTESYGFGGGDDFYLAAHDQHLAMTAQGITYLGASGDSGTADLINDPYPDFDPDVLEVGGSDVTVSGTTRGTELGWTGSGSGWYQPAISFNVLPPYQVGDGVPTNINKRLVPDVALHATAWFFAFNGAIQGVGGTSAATPSFAGQLGLILQTLKENDAADPTPSGRFRLGRIQDFIYPLMAGGSLAFFDITDMDGANAGLLPDGTPSVTKVGWDFVTGLGAPDDNILFQSFLGTSSIDFTNEPTSTAIFSVTSPNLVLGTAPFGDATSLSAADGVSYTLQSVKQNGVGQVAAITIGVPLQTSKTAHSATASVTMMTPTNVTGTIYLFNSSTSQYDLVATVAGTGGMTTTSIPLDLSTGTYTAGNTVKMLVRGLKPTRLGSSTFTLAVDSAIVMEKVSRS